MVQVQLRVPEEMVKEIDNWVESGKFKSRSDAIKTIIELYEEREKTREFYKMLSERSKESKEKPENLIPLEEL
ncbi:MAG: ribbon-helix-helix protein, CopG family [Candidatus Woesearchaeota archaeon]|nr:MAG: ribbon-helix-helix protein, CopG family [Candidatus Woesearchaeota archaeon]